MKKLFSVGDKVKHFGSFGELGVGVIREITNKEDVVAVLVKFDEFHDLYRFAGWELDLVEDKMNLFEFVQQEKKLYQEEKAAKERALKEHHEKEIRELFEGFLDSDECRQLIRNYIRSNPRDYDVFIFSQKIIPYTNMTTKQDWEIAAQVLKEQFGEMAAEVGERYPNSDEEEEVYYISLSL